MVNSSLPSTSLWRLLLDDPATGAWNMGVDEVLWQSVETGALPTLRFYSWQPFCLSVGRLQKQLPPAALHSERSFDLVRRPTGGRAVWHAQEITYSLTTRLDFLPDDARSVNGAYNWLSNGFLLGLRELGLNVALAPSGARAQGTNCFAASAGCDFLADGKKLIGAAQCRTEEALLQHGSLLLAIDQEQWQHNAGGPMNDAVSLQSLGLESDVSTIIAALCRGFEAATGANLHEGQLSGAEHGQAAELARAKYANEAWTSNGKLMTMESENAVEA